MLDLIIAFFVGAGVGAGAFVVYFGKVYKPEYDGEINVVENPEQGKLFSLELSDDPEQLSDKKSVIFKVNSE